MIMLALSEKIEGNIQISGKPKGLYDDGFVGKTLELNVTSQEAIGSVKLLGYIPPNIFQGNRFTLKVGWRKKEIGLDTPEFFQVPLAIRASASEAIYLKIEAQEVINPKKAGMNDDQRNLSFLLVKLVFSPENEVDYIKRGNQLIRQGQIEDAIAAYRYAVELDSSLYWSHYYLEKALKQS